ncbi:MAG: DUF4270 domain-containing protein [Bacteroidetes bacterium]|nr:DUF4270 domain-containing protein [Bacteroidota bacterium]
MKQLLTAGSIILALALFSCSKSTIVGSDLLDQDQVNLGFSDTFTLSGYTVVNDSVRTYDPDFAEQLIGYLVGQMDDPVFGQTTAKINAEFRPGTEDPDFENAVLDSVVLVLPYYNISKYGDTLEFYGLDVFMLDERMDRSENIFSNREFQVAEMIGSVPQFVPNYSDSITIQAHGGGADDTFDLPPQLRITLSESFGNELLNLPVETYEDDSLFLDAIPGIQLSPNTINEGLNAFNLRTNSNAGIFVYYHVDDEYDIYQMPFTSLAARMVNFEHDYTGSVVEDFLNDPEKGDSLLFLQGMSGATFELEIPNTEFLKDKVINRAELEFTAVTLPEDIMSPYEPVIQMIASEVTDTGLVIIQDVVFGLERGDLDILFGGRIEDDTEPAKYRLNLSAHLRRMSLGEVSDKIQITVLARPELANRVVLAGPGHSVSPAILKVNFTNL